MGIKINLDCNTVQDILTSNSTTDPLSANKGRELKELIDRVANDNASKEGVTSYDLTYDTPTGKLGLRINDKAEKIVNIPKTADVEKGGESFITADGVKNYISLQIAKDVFLKEIKVNEKESTKIDFILSNGKTLSLDSSSFYKSTTDGTLKGDGTQASPLGLSDNTTKKLADLDQVNQTNQKIEADIKTLEGRIKALEDLIKKAERLEACSSDELIGYILPTNTL